MANSGSVLLLLQFLLFQKFVYAAEMFSYFSSSKFINFSDKSVQKVAVVAYKDERSVKIFERLFEYVLGFEIKMVGGLVKNQQVDRLQQKFYHAQPHTLSSRQHFHFFLVLFSAKHECPEQIADFQSRISHRNIVDYLKHRKVLIKERCTVLGKITYLHIVAEGDGAVMLDFTHYCLHHSGFPFSVASGKSHFVASVYGERRIAEHCFAIIAFACGFSYHGVVAASGARRKFEPQCGSILFVHLHYIKFLKPFHFALNLIGFGICAFETLYEFLGLCNLFLLVVILFLLLLAPVAP